MNTPIANILSGLLGGLVVLVVGAILIATDVIDTGDTKTIVRERPATQPAATSAGTPGRSVRDIYKVEGRGVVFISASGVSDDQSLFGAPQQGTATGSGFVVDKEGTILTNAHVVEGADSVSVNFEEGGEEIDAEVKGVDPSSDLAVLKVDPADVDHLNPIPLGDSRTIPTRCPAAWRNA